MAEDLLYRMTIETFSAIEKENRYAMGTAINYVEAISCFRLVCEDGLTLDFPTNFGPFGKVYLSMLNKSEHSLELSKKNDDQHLYSALSSLGALSKMRALTIKTSDGNIFVEVLGQMEIESDPIRKSA